MRKLILAGLLVASSFGGSAFAQAISVGAIAGAPFTDVESNVTVGTVSYIPKSPKFVVGGSFQLNLPFRLRLELDALARPASFRVSNLVSDTSATEWRFPVLLQYRLGKGKGIGMQPFVGVGASFEHLYQIKNAVTSGTGSIASNSPGGVVLDGGVDFKLKLFRLSAELRYTRQANDSIVSVSQLNQAEVLAGFHF